MSNPFASFMNNLIMEDGEEEPNEGKLLLCEESSPTDFDSGGKGEFN
jgi:hypothetical protein